MFTKNKKSARDCRRRMVGEGGFEPPKPKATDLQSAPFDRSGIPPYEIGAGGRIRTPDLLITNQLLYQLSYTSTTALPLTLDYCIRHSGLCQCLLQKYYRPFGPCLFSRRLRRPSAAARRRSVSTRSITQRLSLPHIKTSPSAAPQGSDAAGSSCASPPSDRSIAVSPSILSST